MLKHSGKPLRSSANVGAALKLHRSWHIAACEKGIEWSRSGIAEDRKKTDWIAAEVRDPSSCPGHSQ